MRHLFLLFLAASLFALSPIQAASADEGREIRPAGYAAAREYFASVVRGNVQSRIYHNSACRYFACKACTAVFESAREARENGYRACKVCGG